MVKKIKKHFLVFLIGFSLPFSRFLPLIVRSALAGTLQTYDLATSPTYNIRIDGAGANDMFSLLGLYMTDLDNDGKLDLLVGASNTDYNSRSNSGSLYVIYHALLENYTGTGNNIDLANPESYNLRFDGAAINNWLTYGGVTASDINNDGKQDILVAAYPASTQGRTTNGSLYVIYNDIFERYSRSTGNNIDLANASNYSLRYDGAATGDLLSGDCPAVADLDSNGKLDIMVGAAKADNNSRSNSGSLYVIYDSLIDDYTGTGNNIDLANSANYNLRFDGAKANDWLAYGGNTASDLNNDGKQDILVGAYLADNNTRTNSGSLYVIYNSLFSNYIGIGNNIDLNNAANYNLRYDGAVANDELSYWGAETSDLDNDGEKDLLLNAIFADNNSRTDSGSIYVIFDELVDDYSGTGNNIDLANSANYNLRIDGSVTNELLGDLAVRTADIDGDGRQDILTGPPEIYIGSEKGKVYVIYNSLIDDYTGTGNNIDLANEANSNLRYIGASGGHLNAYTKQFVDFNNDGTIDLILPAHQSSFNSRTKSGSLYIIYNYPHSWALDSVSDYLPGAPSNITGRISATGSTTNIYNVQYSLDGSAFYGTWNECPNDGGSYDSTDTEKFKCPITVTLTEGLHKFYLRSSDVNASYTARHKVVDLRIDKTSPLATLTQIDSKSFKDNMNITNSTPTIFGKITDSLSNSLAAGPDYLETELQKKDSSGGWQTIESKRINLTENYWTSNNSKITDNTLNTSNKYSTFSYTPSTKLSTGSYQLSVTGVDKADNHSSPASFQFTLGVNQAQKTPPQPTSEPQPNQPEAETTPIPVFQLGSKTFVKFLPLFLKISLLLSVLALAALTMIKKFR